MAQDHTAHLQLLSNGAAALGLHSGVMIAGNPDPIGRAGEGGEHSGGMGFQPLRAIRIVEIVAQRVDPPRARQPHSLRHPLQRLAAVIGRQELVVARKKARLFKMQIGHQQRVLPRPEQRPRPAILRHKAKLVAAKGESERNGNHDASMARHCCDDKPLPPAGGERDLPPRQRLPNRRGWASAR